MKTRSFSRGHPELYFPNNLPVELADTIIQMAGTGTDCSAFRRMRLVNKAFDKFCRRHLYHILCIPSVYKLKLLSLHLRTLPAKDRLIRDLFIFCPDIDDSSNGAIFRFLRDFAASSVINMGFFSTHDGDNGLIKSICTLAFPSLLALTLSADFVFEDLVFPNLVPFPNVRSVYLDWRRGGLWKGTTLTAIFPSLSFLGLLVSNFGPHIVSIINEVYRFRDAPSEFQPYGPTTLTVPDTVSRISVRADCHIRFIYTNIAMCMLYATTFPDMEPLKKLEFDARSIKSGLGVGYFRDKWAESIEEM